MKEQKYEAYEKAMRQVWADGQVSFDEADMIEALRKSLNITLEEHVEIERKIRKEMEKALSRKGEKTPEPSEPPEPPEPPESPEAHEQPSEITGPEEEDEGEPEEIGGLSTDELSKDLDDLSKSIGELGERLGVEAPPKTPSPEPPREESPSPEPAAEPEAPKTSVDSDLIITEKPEAEVSKSDPGQPSGSSLLGELRTQYQLDRPPSESAKEVSETEPTPTIDEEPEIPGPEGPEAIEEPLAVSEYLDAGKTSFRNKDYSQSVAYLKEALKIDPENKEVKFFLKKVVKTIKQAKAETPTPTPVSAVEAPTAVEESPVPSETESDVTPETGIEEGTAPKVESEEAPTVPISDCKSCSGTGVCTWCKGSAKCYWCQGSGVCTKCNGSKEVDGAPCEFCKGEGTCGSCDGTGNCNWCRGSGKCNSCNPAE